MCLTHLLIFGGISILSAVKIPRKSELISRYNDIHAEFTHRIYSQLLAVRWWAFSPNRPRLNRIFFQIRWANYFWPSRRRGLHSWSCKTEDWLVYRNVKVRIETNDRRPACLESAWLFVLKLSPRLVAVCIAHNTQFCDVSLSSWRIFSTEFYDMRSTKNVTLDS